MWGDAQSLCSLIAVIIHSRMVIVEVLQDGTFHYVRTIGFTKASESSIFCRASRLLAETVSDSAHLDRNYTSNM